MGEFETLLLYVMLFISVILTSSLSQRRVGEILENGKQRFYIKFNKAWFILTFFILWFFYALTDIGSDYYSYINIFNTVQWRDLLSWEMESGYEFLNLFIGLFTTSDYIALIVIKSLILLLYFNVLYSFRFKIHLTIATVAFYSISFFSSFNLISIHLAAALCLIALKHIYLKNKFLPLFYLLLAFSVHYTAIVMIIVYFVYLYFYKNYKKKFMSLKTISLSVQLIFLLVLILPIYEYLTNNISLLYKYRIYEFKDSGVGILQFVYYVPIFILLYIAYYVCKDKNLVVLSTYITMIGFFFALLGYRINVVDRMFVYFVFPHFIFVPYYINELRLRNISITHNNRKVLGLGIMLILSISYYVARWVIYLTVYYDLSVINKYYFLWMR